MDTMAKYLSITETAQALGLSRQTIYNYMRLRKIKPELIAGRQVFSVEEVEKCKKSLLQ